MLDMTARRRDDIAQNLSIFSCSHRPTLRSMARQRQHNELRVRVASLISSFNFFTSLTYWHSIDDSVRVVKSYFFSPLSSIGLHLPPFTDPPISESANPPREERKTSWRKKNKPPKRWWLRLGDDDNVAQLERSRDSLTAFFVWLFRHVNRKSWKRNSNRVVVTIPPLFFRVAFFISSQQFWILLTFFSKHKTSKSVVRFGGTFAWLTRIKLVEVDL